MFDSLEVFYVICDFTIPSGTLVRSGSTFYDWHTYGADQRAITIAEVHHGNYKKLAKSLNNCPFVDTISYGAVLDAKYDSPGLWDIEGDSIYVEHSEPVSREYKKIEFRALDSPSYTFLWLHLPGYWNSPFSMDYPFYLQCPKKIGGKCVSNPYVYPPLGLSIDPDDGDLVMGFDNVYSSSGVYVRFPVTRRITEWREDSTGTPVLLGTYYLTKWFDASTAIQLNSFGYSYQNQASRFTSTQDKMYHFTGDTIDHSFKTTQSYFLGRKHSNKLFWNREFRNSTFTIADPDSLNKTLRLQWIPDSSYVHRRPHPLTLYVQSDPVSIKDTLKLPNSALQMNSKTIQFFISRRPKPQIQLDTQICNHLYLSTSRVEAHGPWNYEWKLVDSTGNTRSEAKGLNAHLLAPVTGRYTVSLKVWGQYYQTSFQLDSSIEVRSVLDVRLPSDTSICRNTCLELRPNVRYANGSVEHIWDDGFVLKKLPSYEVCDSSRVLKVTSQDDSGCTIIGQIRILALDTPKFSLGADTLLCHGRQVGIALSKPLGTTNFRWLDGNQTDTVRTYAAPQVIWAEVQGPNGCHSRAYKRLSSPPRPQGTVSASGSLCPGDSLSLNYMPDSSDQIISVNWLIAGATYNVNPLSYIAPGNFQYRLTIDYRSNGLNCVDTVIEDIFLYPEPKLTLEYDSLICQNALPYQIGLKENYKIERWKNATHVFVAEINKVQGQLQYGPFAHWVEVEDALGCRNSDTAYIRVELPDRVEGLPSDSVFCEGSYGLKLPYFSLQGIPLSWTTDGSGLLVDSLEEWRYTPHLSDYGRRIRFTGSHGQQQVCSSGHAQLEIRFQNSPTVQIELDDTVGCSPFSINLKLQGDHVDQIAWYIDNTLRATGDGQQIELTEGQYRLHATWVLNGCKGQTGQHMLTALPDVAFLGFSIEKRGATEYLLNYKTQTPVHNQTWYLEGLDTSVERSLNLQVYFSGEHKMRLHVVDSNGCELWVDSMLSFRPESFFYIPNAFTPDANNLNEVFRPTVNGYNWYLKVYSRTGQLLFEGRENEPWNGAVNGERASTSVFYYHLLFLKGHEKHIIQGSVHVLY
ncbi:MAG: gliding motility-associated C-terminal domain-containing protein [Flavobacteriales bacterium]|nr:gliding motility-associated C-terminal domain-containing protein [Flavobacteriales bacterium]